MSSSRMRTRARLTLAAGVLAAGALALSGCSGPASADGPTPVSLQLGWIANVENMGPYAAQQHGYYKNEGLDLTITPGGPSTSVEPLVASGKALVGTDSADIIARANEQGASFVIVAASLQVNPISILSLKDKPVKTLADLKGKSICIQTGGLTVLDETLEANGVQPSDVKHITASFDPSPLVAGECDAFTSFLGNQDVTLKMKGIETVSFPLSDYGYIAWGDCLFTTKAVLADPAKRKLVEKVVAGTVRGWQTALKDTDAAAKYIVEGPGKSQNLNLEQQQLAAKLFESLIDAGDAKENGLLTMSKAGIAANIDTFQRSGIGGDLTSLFDTSVLETVYAGKTSLPEK